MPESTPRITAQYLETFQDRVVRIVGKVTLLRGVQATIESNGPVVLRLNPDSHLQMNHYFEVIGRIVQSDLAVKVLNSTDLGTNYDFSAYEALVDATHRYREIFYDD